MPKDFMTLMMLEGRAYQDIDQLEKLTETDLSPLPLQPVYQALSKAPPEVLALALSKLSSPQRQALLDLDFWDKDNTCPELGVVVDNAVPCSWLAFQMAVVLVVLIVVPLMLIPEPAEKVPPEPTVAGPQLVPFQDNT